MQVVSPSSVALTSRSTTVAVAIFLSAGRSSSSLEETSPGRAELSSSSLRPLSRWPDDRLRAAWLLLAGESRRAPSTLRLSLTAGIGRGTTRGGGGGRAFLTTVVRVMVATLTTGRARTTAATGGRAEEGDETRVVVVLLPVDAEPASRLAMAACCCFLTGTRFCDENMALGLGICWVVAGYGDTAQTGTRWVVRDGGSR